MKPTKRLIAAVFCICLCAGCGEERDDSLAAWIEMLDHPDVNERYRAATALSERGAEAVPALMDRLAKHTRGMERPGDEGDHDPRKIVANTLVLIGEPAVPALIDALTLEEELERRLAASALQRIGVADEHLPKLIEVMDHDNPMVAGIAAGLLVESKPGKPLLQGVLTDGSSSTRSKTRAIRALATLDDDALQSIIDALGSSEPPVRLEAVKALSALSRRVDTTAALIPRLDDDDEQVRVWTATALRGNGERALDALSRVLAEGSARARSLAAGVLSALGERALPVAPALAENLAHGDPLVRVRSASALHAVAGDVERSLPVLVASARGDDPTARLEAVTALAAFEESAETVVPVLLAALRGEDEAAARRAARSLGALGPSAGDAIEALERAALADDDVLRENAKRSLKAIREDDK